MILGYLIPEFPSQTHVFFWREAQQLRSQGVELHFLSTRRPLAGSCKHGFAPEAIAQTRYLFPPRWLAAIATLIARPIATLRCLNYITQMRETPILQRIVKFGLLLSAADLFGFARELKIEHIHVHSCADAAHVVALCQLLGGPSFSLTLHGNLPVYGKDHALKMRAAKFVACVTSPLRAEVAEVTGFDLQKIPLLWMGVDTTRFVPKKNSTLVFNQLSLITVARLNVTKGHCHALAAIVTAIEAGCDVRYTIAGEGPHRAVIESTIQELKLGNCVELLGTQSEDAIKDLLQRADAFVLPSFGLGEAAPVSVMEAMASGLPVICSIIGGTADMIDGGTDGILVPQRDEKALAAAIIRLARSPVDREMLGLAAREKALEKFDVARTSEALLRAIQASLEPTEGND